MMQETEDLYELSKAEIKMIEEGLADYEANPESGSSWEGVMKRLTLSFQKEGLE
jgi:hypothetical protein